MSLSTYLSQRGKRGTWQLRVPVPRAYKRRHGGPAEKVRSLKTTDRAIAAKRALPILSEWQAVWDDVAALPFSVKIAASQHSDEVAFEVAYEGMLAALELQRRAWPTDDEGYGTMADKRRADLRRFARALSEGDLSRWHELGDRITTKRGLDLERDGHTRESFAAMLGDLNVAAIEVFQRRTEGEISAEPKSDTVLKLRSELTAKAEPGETLLDLYDSYAKWRSEPGRKRRRRPESFTQDRVVVELLAEFVGYDRAVASITKDDAKRFRAMLPDFPLSRSKKRELADASIAECVAIAKRDMLPTLSLTTQAKYLSIISPFFGWLVSDSTVSVPTNIFDGLHHKLERGENRRPSFSASQLNQLLKSPLFAKCGGKGREHRAGKTEVRDWRYWIPLLAMFTGSRITEVAQLHVDDVAVREGVALILLAHEEEKGQFLKNKKGRLAALHAKLIDAGFLDFWRKQLERADQDDNRQLFPELTAGKRVLLGDKPGRWFRRYLERLGVKDGADGFGAHSFRHTMTDAMRAAGFLDLEFGQLVLGHANNSITAAYGKVPQGTPENLIRMLNAAFNAEPFKQVDFSSLTAARS